MSLPPTIAAYKDCEELFQTAAAGAKGARAQLATYEECVGMRTRLHYFRKLLRKESETIYQPGMPQYGVSGYDDFVVQIIPDEDGGWWIYIQRRATKILAIETLDEEDGLIEAAEVKLLEDRTDG